MVWRATLELLYGKLKRFMRRVIDEHGSLKPWQEIAKLDNDHCAAAIVGPCAAAAARNLEADRNLEVDRNLEAGQTRAPAIATAEDLQYAE